MKTKTTMLYFILILTSATQVSSEVIDNLNNANTKTDANQTSNIVNLNSVQEAFNTSSNTDNIKICQYSARSICKVRIRERMPAIIQLPQFEEIASWVLGDNQNFDFDILDNSKRKAVLRGIIPGADTNLNIVGESGLIYPFYIRIDSSSSKYLSDFIVNVKLKDKDKNTLQAFELAKRKKALLEEQENKKADIDVTKNEPDEEELDYLDKKALINVSELSFKFKQVSGDSSLMPTKIFDDGIWTYFKYGDKNLVKTQDLPVIYKVKDGFDTPVNSRIEGGYLIAETTADKWTIRSGQTYACVHKVE